MSNKTLLSICIPTYNRSQYLAVQLEDIFNQLNSVPPATSDQIEIVVSDNDSNDDTVAVVKSFMARMPGLRYRRNSTNLDVDRNIDAVLSEARGVHCWLLSDDDFLASNAVDYIVTILRRYPDIAYFCIGVGEPLPDFAAEFYVDGNDFLKRAGLSGGLISQNIYRRDVLPDDCSRYFGNFWIQLSLAWEIMSVHPAAMIGNVFVKVETPCRWATDGKVFPTYLKLIENVNYLLNLNYDKYLIKSLVNDLVSGLPHQIASARIHGLPMRLQNFKIVIKNFFSYPWRLILSLIALSCPIFVLKLVRKYFVYD